MYKKNFTPLLYSLISLILISCTAQAQTNDSNTKLNNCSLITREEVEAIQKEPVKEIKSNSQTFDNRLITQCFYQLTTYAKSISVQVTQASPKQPEKANLLGFWKGIFHSGAVIKNENSKTEENKINEKRSNVVVRVFNLGDEAFLAGNQITLALYVLKKNNIIRISIGGAEKEQIRIQKMKILAGKLINRL